MIVSAISLVFSVDDNDLVALASYVSEQDFYNLFSLSLTLPTPIFSYRLLFSHKTARFHKTKNFLPRPLLPACDDNGCSFDQYELTHTHTLLEFYPQPRMGTKRMRVS